MSSTTRQIAPNQTKNSTFCDGSQHSNYDKKVFTWIAARGLLGTYGSIVGNAAGGFWQIAIRILHALTEEGTGEMAFVS